MLAHLKKSEIISSFGQKLLGLGVSKNTLKNYYSDLGIFTSWLISKLATLNIETRSFDEALPFLSGSFASEFKTFLESKAHSESTINRRLSSLRGLSRFMLESQICDFDFMTGVTNMSGVLNTGAEAKNEPVEPTLLHFQKHLESQKISKNTIKNYISDIKHFMAWLESNQDLGSKI